MSNKTKKSIICDHCDKELTTEGSRPATYVLELKAIDVNTNNTGFVYAISIKPPIEETMHFCGVNCLTRWLEERHRIT